MTRDENIAFALGVIGIAMMLSGLAFMVSRPERDFWTGMAVALAVLGSILASINARKIGSPGGDWL